jgi:hypothetical protein
MAKPRKSQDEKDLERLPTRGPPTPRKPSEESKLAEKKDKPAKRLRRPVDSEADT